MTQQPDTAAEIGQYRPAARVREGWHVRVLPADGNGPAEWVEITHVLQILAPVKATQITLADGTRWAAGPDADLFCRTTTEITRAAKGV